MFSPAIAAFIIFGAVLTGSLWSVALCRGLRGTARRFLVGHLGFTVSFVISVHAPALIELLFGDSSFGPLSVGLMAGILLTISMPTALIVARSLAAELHTGGSADGEDTLPDKGPRLDRALALAAIILAGIHAVFLIDTAFGFPNSWDGTAYHLPMAVEWLQQGSLRMPEDTYFFFSLPSNAGCLTVIALMTGRLSLGELAMWPSGLGGMAAVFIAARGLGSARNPAILAALIFGSIPMVMFQMTSSYVDLFGTTFILTAIALTLDRPFRSVNGRFVTLAAIGLSLGVATGTKPTLWPYVAAVGLWVMFQEARRSASWADRIRRIVIAACALGAAGLATTGFWFVRGVAQTGNPIYPAPLKAGSISIGQHADLDHITPSDYQWHFVRSEAEWAVYPWIEWTDASPMHHFAPGRGTGPAFAAFIPAVLFGLGRGLLKPGKRRLQREAAILTLAFMAIWFFALPHLPRFALPAAGMMALFAGLGADRLAPSAARRLGWLLVASLAVGGVLVAHVPLRQLAERAELNAWRHGEFYKHPQALKALPPDAILMVIWPHRPSLFGLYGPELRRPLVHFRHDATELTAEALAASGADYVLLQDSPPEGFPGNLPLVLVADNSQSHWRLYRAEH